MAMQIGKFTFNEPVFLAPMAGVTDFAFRELCRSCGAAMTTTEMVSAKAIKYKNKNTYELMTLACESCGLELGMKKRDFTAFANGHRELSLYADNDIKTWRDCVSWIAQAIGCNVLAGRDGRIVLRAYGQTVVDTIDTEHRLNGSTFDDYETRYTGLSVVNAAEQMSPRKTSNSGCLR